MSSLPDKPWFRPREVADLFGISIRQVYQLIQQGDLVAVRLSPRCTRISRDSISKLIQAA